MGWIGAGAGVLLARCGWRRRKKKGTDDMVGLTNNSVQIWKILYVLHIVRFSN
jgi:hypothetical protein